MAFYITRRLAWTAVVVLVVLMLTFVVFYLMPAGDPALRFAGKSPTEQSLELVRERLGLDQPLYDAVRPSSSKNFVAGDQYGWPGLGYSYVQQPARARHGEAPGAEDAVADCRRGVIWLVVGVTIGVLSAVKRRIARRPGRHGLRALRHLVRPSSGSA